MRHQKNNNNKQEIDTAPKCKLQNNLLKSSSLTATQRRLRSHIMQHN